MTDGSTNFLEVFERDTEFMSFFYQHLTACPPHGPFRLYSAITFVERARRRFATAQQDGGITSGGDAGGAAPRKRVRGDGVTASDGSSASAGSLRGEPSDQAASHSHSGNGSGGADETDALAPSTFALTGVPGHGDAVFVKARSQLLAALTPPNVLALMERKYATSHLCGWPLLYVPAEIHSAEVAAVMAEQEARQQR